MTRKFSLIMPRQTFLAVVSIVWSILVFGCGPGRQASNFPPGKSETVAPPRTKPDPNATVPISFEDLDLFEAMGPGEKFEDWMLTQRVRDLDGRKVRITGFMFGGGFQLHDMKTFILLREKECPYGSDGQAYHAIEVELEGKLRTSYTTAPVTLEGKLSVRPFNGPDGKTWSLYHLAATKID